jgi:hypothetical protein
MFLDFSILPDYLFCMKIKIPVIIFAVFLSAAYACGADDEKKPEPPPPNEGEMSDLEGIFKIRNWDGDIKRPEIKDDARNVIREEIPSDEKTRTTTEGLASKLEIKEKLSWKPLWKYEGIGGADLPSIALSDDKTLMAIVERTGELSGPNGSRIVVLRTADWKILRIHEIQERKIEKLIFLPEKAEAAVFSSKQSSLKMPNEILKIDLDSGEILADKKTKDAVASMAVSGEFLAAFFKPETADRRCELLSIDTESFDIKDKLATENTNGVVAGDPYSQGTFLFAGDKQIEIFDGSKPAPSAKFANTEDAVPSNAIFLGDSGIFCVVYSARGAYIFKDGKTRKIVEKGEFGLDYERSSQKLMVGEFKGNRSVIFSIPSLDEYDAFSVNAIKPKTGSNLIFCASARSNGGYLFGDNFGNVFKCFKSGKKWKKQIIFEPMK